MSILVMTEVFRRRFGSCAKKGVALKLADHADDEGKGIWPSLARLAANCDVSEATARRILQDFVDGGLLVLVRQGGQGPGSTNRYDLDLEVLKAMPLAGSGPSDAPVKPENKGSMVIPLAEDKGINGEAKGSNGDEKGYQGDTQTVSIEPSDSNHHSQRAEAREREVEDRKKVQEAFKRFGPTWPTWVSDSTATALKAWMALPPGERERAAELAPAYLAAEKASGRTKTCALAVYLTERRWEKLPERTGAATEALTLPAYGKGWMAHRLWLLENRQPQEWKPAPMMARWIAEGREDLVAEPRRRGKHPLVARLDEDAKASRGVVLRDASAAPDAEHYVVIARGSAEWQAWEAWHHERDWPWVDPPKHKPFVYVPSQWPEGAMAERLEA